MNPIVFALRNPVTVMVGGVAVLVGSGLAAYRARVAEASTLSVVNGVRAARPRMREAVPEDVSIDFTFDQSEIVTESIWTAPPASCSSRCRSPSGSP